ncbi:MAG: hypothetical protein HND52_13435 [Ignavibacteriae bacterium]|jgi:hypothetical protein|nr:hypothetical protein [Ignavibacteriota bacterium]NOG98956.1 hypothetical protein [Ignavibacteriota bacterium]
MKKVYSITKPIKKIIERLYLAAVIIMLLSLPNSLFAQSQPIGPGNGSYEKNQIMGQFLDWDRKATPKLVLRVHGAGKLQTFADISATGEFKISLPEIPADGNYGTLNCGDPAKGSIVLVTDFSLLTTLPGFSSPGRWDRGLSVIGMAIYSDETFSKNIGKPGGKRAQWLYSNAARTVEAGECNNSNSFPLEVGWNVFTVISGPSGGPHAYNPGLDNDLGWYWYAFPEDAAQNISPSRKQKTDNDDNSKTQVSKNSELQKSWLLGDWNGVQLDTKMHLRLKDSGEVWLESIEGGSKKTIEGTWLLKDGEFALDIKEGGLRFNIEQTSETSFRLFGKAASSDIVFTRKK